MLLANWIYFPTGIIYLNFTTIITFLRKLKGKSEFESAI